MPQAKILIVEDEPMLSEAYSIILNKAGYKIFTAFDGLEAIEITKDFEPDLILLDLRMPRMDGVGFLTEYDIINKHPKVKVIVFSNIDMENETEAAHQLGASKYILKAWASPKELIKIVQEILKEEKF